MTDEKVLKDLIKKQEEMVQNALDHLNNLKKMATDSGVEIKEFNTVKSINIGESIKEEIMRKRNEIMNKIDKVKKQSQNKAQEAIDKAKSDLLTLPKTNIDLYNNLSNMPLAQDKDFFNTVNIEELVKNVPEDKRKALREILKKIPKGEENEK